MDYVYPYREKGRPRSKSHLHSKYIDSSEIVYETEEHMDSYELDEEQVSVWSKYIQPSIYNIFVPTQNWFTVAIWILN